MNEVEVYISQFHFNYKRTIGFLNQMEESPVGLEGLYWRMPFGKGRAHIGWQILHLSATYHKFAYFVNPVQSPMDEEFIKNFGHGSKPDENKKFTFSEIKVFLDRDTGLFLQAFANFPVADLDKIPTTTERTYREILMLMNWHEAVHIGQSQITWNAFRASKGMMD